MKLIVRVEYREKTVVVSVSTKEEVKRIITRETFNHFKLAYTSPFLES